LVITAIVPPNAAAQVQLFKMPQSVEFRGQLRQAKPSEIEKAGPRLCLCGDALPGDGQSVERRHSYDHAANRRGVSRN
jgi:hypothetical protein